MGMFIDLSLGPLAPLLEYHKL